MNHRDQGLQNWTGGTLKTIKLIGMNSRFAKICTKTQEQKWSFFSVKLFNFSAIFVLVPLCKFLSTLLCSKYLQSNFEVLGPCGSLSWGFFLHFDSSKGHREISIFCIFLQYPHQVQIKNVVKLWKEFLEKYCDYFK